MISCLLTGKVMIIHLIAGYIKRISFYKMNYSITYSHGKNKIQLN